jgi:hypothetical protein
LRTNLKRLEAGRTETRLYRATPQGPLNAIALPEIFKQGFQEIWLASFTMTLKSQSSCTGSFVPVIQIPAGLYTEVIR